MSKKIFDAAAGVNTHGMYHPNAQRFIKSAQGKGMTVKAEGAELIAYPKNRNSNISSDGKALVPTPGLARMAVEKKADQAFIKKADKKLKGFDSSKWGGEPPKNYKFPKNNN